MKQPMYDLKKSDFMIIPISYSKFTVTYVNKKGQIFAAGLQCRELLQEIIKTENPDVMKLVKLRKLIRQQNGLPALKKVK